MIKASELSLKTNHALLRNCPQFKVDPNHLKYPIHMLTGDPTKFGLEECKMNEEGYEIVRKAIQDPESHSYCQTTGLTKARQAIIKHFNNGQKITIDDVIITAGVNLGLYYLFLAICEEGDNILVPEIGYPFFDEIAPSYQVERITKVRKYKLQKDNHWQVDLDHLNQILDEKTKYIFIINPSNPLGSVFSRSHVNEIINWANANKVLIISDEVYYGSSFGEYVSFGELANEGPVICLSGMEKIFYVPGWATSWMIFYDKNNILCSIKEGVQNMCQLFLHSNTFIMAALPEILDTLGTNFVRRANQKMKNNNDKIVQALGQVPGLNPIPAQGTFYLSLELNFTLLKFSNDVEFIKKLLEEENISAFPLSIQGNKQFQGLRLMTCIKDEIVDALIQRIRDFCERHKK